MKFLLDQDVWASTAQFLENLGHNVIRVSQIGLSKADDENLLNVAKKQRRIFVTRDRDFGAIVFVKELKNGVLYLRVLPSTQKSVHSELGKVLLKYRESELQKAFVVIEPGGHRIRKLSV